MADPVDYKVIIWLHDWACTNCKENPRYLFVYGDNLLHRGRKGQAIIRNEPNTIGIVTKKRPSMDDDAFYYQQDYDAAVANIHTSIHTIETLMTYKVILLHSKQ